MKIKSKIKLILEGRWLLIRRPCFDARLEDHDQEVKRSLKVWELFKDEICSRVEIWQALAQTYSLLGLKKMNKATDINEMMVSKALRGPIIDNLN